jgi:hypothetical protein
MAKAKSKTTRGKKPPPGESPPTTPVDPSLVPLDNQEQLFVEEYLYDRNYAHAFRRLNPECNHRNARQQGWEIGHRPNVAREIRDAVAAQKFRKRAHADRVIDEIALLAMSDIADLYDPQTHQLRHPRHIPYETRKCIASVNRNYQGTAHAAAQQQ